MRLENSIQIGGVASEIPANVVTAMQALAAGRTDSEDVTRVGVDCLPASAEHSGPQLAARAAEKALRAAGWDASSLDMLIHAWVHHQGHDFWSPAHYVADTIGAGRAVPVGVQQMCNGAASGIEIAVARLTGDPRTSRALVTTGDRFADEGFDRWRGDYGVWYGDGGTACLLQRNENDCVGLPSLLAIASRAIPEVESLHRGVDAFTPAARWLGPIVDVRRTKKGFIEARGLDAFYTASHAAIRGVVTDAMADAGLEMDDKRVSVLTVPRVGRAVIAETYVPALEGLTKAQVTFTGQRTGHLGAGDLIANIDLVLSSKLWDAGDIGLFVSAGGGFTFSCAVVQFGSGGSHE